MRKITTDLAQELGRRAAQRGVPRSDNPYGEGEGALWQAWNAGHRDWTAGRASPELVALLRKQTA